MQHNLIRKLGVCLLLCFADKQILKLIICMPTSIKSYLQLHNFIAYILNTFKPMPILCTVVL